MNERFEEILSLLKGRGSMSVRELARELFVSEMTVRRDLKALAANGRIQRYNGGAMLFAKETELPFSERKLLYSDEKIRLSKEAALYIEDSSTVFIDSSSTCMYIIPQLAGKKDIKIITNSISNTALAAQYHIPCVLIGGNFYERDMCTVGSMATEALNNINVDIAFFSSLALSEDGIISDSDEAQTAVRRSVIKNAGKTVFIFTKSKQNKKATYSLCKSEDAFKIIME